MLITHFGFAKEVLIAFEILVKFLYYQAWVQFSILLGLHGVIPDLGLEQVFNHLLALLFDPGFFIVFHYVVIGFFIIKFNRNKSCEIIFYNIFEVQYFLVVVNAFKRVSFCPGWLDLLAQGAISLKNINDLVCIEIGAAAQFIIVRVYVPLAFLQILISKIFHNILV